MTKGVSHPCWGSRSQKVNSGLAVAAQDLTAQLSGVGMDSGPEPGVPAPRLKVWELILVTVLNTKTCNAWGEYICASVCLCVDECDVRVPVNSYQMNVPTPPCKKIMSNIRCEVIMILVREIEHIQANHWSDDILEYTITGEHDNKRMLEELYVHWVRVLHICTPKLQLILINLKISFKIESILKILKPTRERNNSIGNGCDFMFARHSTCK